MAIYSTVRERMDCHKTLDSKPSWFTLYFFFCFFKTQMTVWGSYDDDSSIYVHVVIYMVTVRVAVQCKQQQQ